MCPTSQSPRALSIPTDPPRATSNATGNPKHLLLWARTDTNTDKEEDKNEDGL